MVNPCPSELFLESVQCKTATSFVVISTLISQLSPFKHFHSLLMPTTSLIVRNDPPRHHCFSSLCWIAKHPAHSLTYRRVRSLTKNRAHTSHFCSAVCLDQRSKELSYKLRLCHLNAMNSEGVQAPNFGFELSEDSKLEYPVISRVEAKSPGERAGLQSRDILLKVNDRKTKGLEFEKVKKVIEKAKRDGRLEMLVVDQETYDYCKRNNKQWKEPDIKVKHIFPKSRSSVSSVKLPMIAGTSAHPSRDQLKRSELTPLSTSLIKETEWNDDDDDEPISSPLDSIVPSDALSPLSPPVVTAPTHSPHQAPFTSIDLAPSASQPIDVSDNDETDMQHSSSSGGGPTKNIVSNAINNLLHKMGHSKAVKRS